MVFRTRSSKFKLRPVACVLLQIGFVVALSAGVSPKPSEVPSSQQVVEFLTDSIDWYRHRAVERQIATEPVDLTFLEDNRPLAREIARLAFDFARADAAILSRPAESSDKQNTGEPSGSSPDLQQFLLWQRETEAATQQATQEIEEIRRKLLTAHGEDRRKLQAAMGAAQGRVSVLQAGSATLQQLVEFVRSFGIDRSETWLRRLTI